MAKKCCNRIATTLSIILVLFMLFIGTDGFTVFTAESARKNKLIEEKPKFPEVILEDSKERTYTMETFRGKHVLITFVYTACTTVCPELERNLEEVYQSIPAHYIGEEIIFLTISFDPERDDPETLENYRQYFNSDGETWRMARVPDQQQLESLLDAFGVIVIPDEYGFSHNSAFYFVNKDGYLENVLDYTDINAATEYVVRRLEGGK
ncbi:SCO family protein [Gracilibacillus salitolerans]|uniref:SCO family protein n=1 Tax=Gracilibacillus salitolerans TaxID=2663022 RepID=A0A5Q2TMW1_9BACI|nr:SCO family protein [Gracilibacillus salitolerans]QGH35491.1 SCO family protein [Gracilibacillus salitolerans]